MKIDELMIGNYVMDDDESNKIFKVKSITKGKKETKSNWFINGRIIEDIKPILLTEEWLPKFGAKKTEYGFDLFGYAIDISSKRPYFGHDWQDYRTPIDYVHQLQNLYFALTGQQLKLLK